LTLEKVIVHVEKDGFLGFSFILIEILKGLMGWI